MSAKFFSILFSRSPLDRRTPAQLNEAIKGGDGKALSILEQLAHQGNADAQLELGFLYAKGIGLPQSYLNAAAWYTKAADQGVLNAQYNLGVMYFKGEGVDQDYKLALTCLEEAASHGHANAQELASKIRALLRVLQEEQLLNSMLGRNVVAGIKDQGLARRYLLELKDIASSEAVRRSIQTHLMGLGIGLGAVQEVQRCIELSERFSSVTQVPVDEVLQLAALNKLDRVMLSAEHDIAIAPLGTFTSEELTAEYNLGVTYLNGHGDVPRNLEMAYKTFRSAADKGHVRAQFNLGGMYITGTYVSKDSAIAASWFAKAAKGGHADAAFNLANMFLAGTGIEQSNQQAHLYLCLAAENGHPSALEYVHKFLASNGLDKDGMPLE